MNVWRVTAVLLAVVLTASAIATAEENPAAARIEAMAGRLAGAPAIGVSVDCAWDAVQESGEKIELGERRDVTLRRPDRARVDVAGRDGSRRGIVFDGTRLTVFDAGDKDYATVEKPGTVDATLEYYTQRLRMRVPLRELFSADLPHKLKDALPSSRLVGRETIGGKACDHVWLRLDDADVEVWIAREGEPLPQRIVITYRHAEGRPQFRADFRGWTWKPDVADSVFSFTPAPGAEKIPLLAPGRRGPREPKQP